MKRGQVTTFVIIGIIMLVALGVGLYVFSSEEIRDVEIIDRTEDRNPELLGVRTQVEFCLNDLTKQGLITLGRQGGYIEKPQNLISNSALAFNNNALTFVDGTQLPFSYRLASSPTCSVCEFERNFPPLEFGTNSIKRQLERYINQNIASCSNLNQFEDQFNITAQIPFSTVEFGQSHTNIRLDWPITVIPYNQETQITERYYDNNLNIDFRNIYDVAQEILDFHLIEDDRLEVYTREVITQLSLGDVLPPIFYREIQSSNPQVYDLEQGFSQLKNELSQNINMLQVYGSRGAFVPIGLVEPLQNIYDQFQIYTFTNISQLSNLRISFNYLDTWPTYIDVSPSYGMVAMPDSRPISMLGLIRIPRMIYDFRYTTSVPYVIEIEDISAFGGEEPYTFRFAYESNLRDSYSYSDTQSSNQRTAGFASADQRVTNITVFTINGYTGLPIENISVSYDCVDQGVGLGLTKLNEQGIAKITSPVPECISPVIYTLSSDYFSDEVLVEDHEVELIVYPKQSMEISFVKRMLSPKIVDNDAGFVDFEWELSTQRDRTLRQGENITIYLNKLSNGEPTMIFDMAEFSDGVLVGETELVPGEYNVVAISMLDLEQYYDGEKNYFETQKEIVKIDPDTPLFASAIQAIGGLFGRGSQEDEFEIEGVQINDTMIVGSFSPEQTLTITSDDIINNQRLVVQLPAYDLNSLIYTRQMNIFGAMQNISEEYLHELQFIFE